MIRLVEALNYRCLRHVRQPLKAFHVLVGPNASGKSSFLDVLMFLSRLATDGLEEAIAQRAASIHDLFWRREGNRFELAIEAVLPEDAYPPVDFLDLRDEGYAIRYEVAIGLDESGAVRILDEQILICNGYRGPGGEVKRRGEDTIFLGSRSGVWTQLLDRSKADGEYSASPEVPDEETVKQLGTDQYWPTIRSSGKRPIFHVLNEDAFPTAVWLERVLREQIVLIDLQSDALRQPSRPGQGDIYAKNGSNLPWLIGILEEEAPERYRSWIEHLQQALPDVAGVRVVERPEDRYRYLLLRYQNGLEAPSWMLSDGTLHLLALTLIAYLPPEGASFLIEEPETSIHPLNIEVVMQSLSSVYDGQALVATHSPAVLALVEPADVLVFSRDCEGGTRVIRGDEHPGLRDWRGQPNLSVLYASGVLG